MNARTPPEHLEPGGDEPADRPPDTPPPDPLELALAPLTEPETPPAGAFDGLVLAAREASGRLLARVVLTEEARTWFGPVSVESFFADWPDEPFGAPAAGRAGLQLHDIEDLAAEPRWSDHPLVSGPPHLRSHASQPLVLGTRRVGSLCVMDSVPGALSRSAQAALAGLAQAAVALLESRRAAHERQQRMAAAAVDVRQAVAGREARQLLQSTSGRGPQDLPVLREPVPQHDVDAPAPSAGVPGDGAAAGAAGPNAAGEAAWKEAVQRPLRVLQDQLETWRSDPEGSGSADRLVPALQSVARYAADLCAPPARPSPDARPRTSLQEALDTCAQVLAPDTRLRRAHLSVRVADGTPAVATASAPLVTLLLSLLDNALLQSPDGAILTVRAQPAPGLQAATGMTGSVQVEIIDQGAGLPPAVQDALAPEADAAQRQALRQSTPALRRVLDQVDALGAQLHAAPGKQRGTVMHLSLPAAG
jgi:signal transduction histidine kinase